MRLVLIALLAGLPAAALAEGRVLVIGVGDGIAPEDLTRVLAAAAEDARLHGRRLEPVARAVLEARLEEEERQRIMTQARRDAAEGAFALDHLEMSRALTLLRRSLDGFAALLPAPSACASAARALQDLAFARWQRGEHTLAQALLAGAADLSSASLDEKRFPPAFRAFASSSKRPPPVAVALPDPGPGGSVYLGCREISWQRAVTVAGSALLRVSATGRQHYAALLVPGHEPATPPHALPPREAPWEGRSCRVLLGRAEALVLWRRSGVALTWKVIGPDCPLGRWRTVPVRNVRPRSEPRPRRPVTWGGWALAGVAAASAVTGAVFLGLALDARSQIERAATQGEIFDEELAALDRRRSRLGPASYALLGVGAAAAVASAVVFLRGRPSKAAREGAARLEAAGPVLRLRF